MLILDVNPAEQAEPFGLLGAESFLLIELMKARLVLAGVVVHEANAISQADDKLVACLVRLHRSDEVRRLLPVDDFA